MWPSDKRQSQHDELVAKSGVFAQKFVHEAVKCRKDGAVLAIPVDEEMLQTSLDGDGLWVGVAEFLDDLLRDPAACQEYHRLLELWLARYWVEPGTLVDWIELPLVNIMDGTMSLTDEQLGTVMVNPKLFKRYTDTVRNWPKGDSGQPDTSFLNGELAE